MLPSLVPWCQGKIFRVLPIIWHHVEMNQMRILPCWLLLPFHSHNLKSTVRNKEKLSLIATVAALHIIDMHTAKLGVDLDDVDDRRKATDSFCLLTKCALIQTPVGGSCKKHWDEIHFSNWKECPLLLWQTSTRKQPKSEANQFSLHSTLLSQTVYPLHNGHHTQQDSRVIHKNGLIQDGTKLVASELVSGCQSLWQADNTSCKSLILLLNASPWSFYFWENGLVLKWRR